MSVSVKDVLADVVAIQEKDLKIEEQIGQGSFSTVFKADYFGRKVAVKKLKGYEDEEEALAAFITREVAVLKEVKHPFCCEFLGICNIGGDALKAGTLWIVSEFVPYGELCELLDAKDVEIAWKLRVRFAMDAASAMAYLHSKDIIHRDLKSENFLLADDLRVKIADFGFARTATMAGPTGVKSRRTMTAAGMMNTLCGTEPYMAPELAMGVPYTAAIDVFSFGITIIEIITRLDPDNVAIARLPGDSFALDKARVLNVVPMGAPEEFVAVGFACCEFEPSDRPDFREVYERLETLFNSIPNTLGWDRPSQAEKKTNSLAFSSRLSLMVQGDQLNNMLSEVKISASQGECQAARSRSGAVSQPDLSKEDKDKLVQTVVEMVGHAKKMLAVEGEGQDAVFQLLMELIQGPLKRYTKILEGVSKTHGSVAVKEATNLVSMAKAAEEYPDEEFSGAVVEFMNSIRETVKTIANR